MIFDIDRHEKSRLAVVDNEGHRLSYGDLEAHVLQMKEHAQARSITFCLCKNAAGSLIGYLALMEAGAVPVMLGSRIDRELLDQLLAVYDPAYIWCPEDQESSFDYEPLYRDCGYVLLKTGSELYPIHDNLQLLMTTSGSTGSPKLVRYKHGNLAANARNVAAAFGWTKNERPVCDLGMNYTMGLNVINTHLYVGATVLLTTCNLMSGDFWDYIREERATNFTGVPFSYDILWRLRFPKMDLPHLTTLAEGGGRLTDKRFTELVEYAKATGKRFIATFGTTETAARLSLLPPELAESKCGSIGRAIPEGELFLVDDDGQVIQEMVAEGEMCYKGPNVTMGYAVCKEDLQKGDEWNGVYHTGDLAKRDEDGCYFITGRKSRFLKLLSYRVSLDQCEQMISQRFGIECACTGTDECMDIYITQQEHEAAIREFISEKTGLFNRLFKVYAVDSLPRNDSGKIAYQELRHGD